MRWTLERVSQPAFEPVRLAEMKRHLRASDATSPLDGDIEALIKSAREWVEDYTGRALIDQQWRLTLSPYLGRAALPAGAYSGDYRESATGEILLRRSPVLGIVSVGSFDSDGAETAASGASYEARGVDTKWPTLYPLSGASWGAGEQRIVFRAGYADTTGSPQEDASVVPERYKQAIKLHVEAHYDRNPETMKMLLDAAKALVKDERCSLSMA